MSGLFRTFLSGLRVADYCVTCLSRIYERPSTTIAGYLEELGIVGGPGECSNCGERTETFRAGPS